MEVIKHGDPDRVKQTKVFECKECGCVFKADKDEYREIYLPEMLPSPFRLVCNCPDCNSEAEAATISLNATKQESSPCKTCPIGDRSKCCGCNEYNDWQKFMERMNLSCLQK